MADIANICAKRLDTRALRKIFPPERSGAFFEALFGDPSEGSYDIELAYRGVEGSDTELDLIMELRLHQRPGCCLACNLTSGLPNVFARHPIIDIAGVVDEIDVLLGNDASCTAWHLKTTEQVNGALHIVPLCIELSVQ